MMRSPKPFDFSSGTRRRVGSFRQCGLIQEPFGCLIVHGLDRDRPHLRKFLKYLFQKWAMRAKGETKGLLQYLYGTRSENILQEQCENVFNISPIITLSLQSGAGVSHVAGNVCSSNRIRQFVYSIIQKLGVGARGFSKNQYVLHTLSKTLPIREKPILHKMFFPQEAIFRMPGQGKKGNEWIRSERTRRDARPSISDWDGPSDLSSFQNSQGENQRLSFFRTMERRMVSGWPSPKSSSKDFGNRLQANFTMKSWPSLIPHASIVQRYADWNPGWLSEHHVESGKGRGTPSIDKNVAFRASLQIAQPKLTKPHLLGSSHSKSPFKLAKRQDANDVPKGLVGNSAVSQKKIIEEQSFISSNDSAKESGNLVTHSLPVHLVRNPLARHERVMEKERFPFSSLKNMWRVEGNRPKGPVPTESSVFSFETSERMVADKSEPMGLKTSNNFSFLRVSHLGSLTSLNQRSWIGGQSRGPLHNQTGSSPFLASIPHRWFLGLKKVELQNHRHDQGSGIGVQLAHHLREGERVTDQFLPRMIVPETSSRFPMMPNAKQEFSRERTNPFSRSVALPIGSGEFTNHHEKKQLGRDIEILQRTGQREQMKFRSTRGKDDLIYIPVTPLPVPRQIASQGGSWSSIDSSSQASSTPNNTGREGMSMAETIADASQKLPMSRVAIQSVADKVYSMLVSKVKREQELRRK